MYVIPDALSSYAVAPVTIGTLVIGWYDVSYGYTSAVRDVLLNILKFVPKQQVSALVSHSLSPYTLEPGSFRATAKEGVVDWIFLLVVTALICSHGGPRLDDCSFRPPMMVDPLVVAEMWLATLTLSGGGSPW